MQKRNINNSKAISPVVATILLVLIAVSISFSAYTWYSGMKEETQVKAETKFRQDLTRIFAEVKIIKVNATSGEILIENTGGTTLHNLNLSRNLVQVATKDSLGVGEIWSVTTTLTSGDVLYLTTLEGASDRYEV
ncbi:MAG: hypothetical protein DRN95_04300 [Candidatus Hydrothermarchaeota archaeon]|nr:MAG: hypothetical protein DRN95_04300 [Candidatus Hydrothermarchaeota archaeon]